MQSKNLSLLSHLARIERGPNINMSCHEIESTSYEMMNHTCLTKPWTKSFLFLLLMFWINNKWQNINQNKRMNFKIYNSSRLRLESTSHFMQQLYTAPFLPIPKSGQIETILKLTQHIIFACISNISKLQ